MNTDPINYPDYDYWLKFDVWSATEAISLLFNIDPRKANILLPEAEMENNYNQVVELIDLFIASEDHSLEFEKKILNQEKQELLFEVAPKKFIQWAFSKGYDIPAPLWILLDKPEAKPEITKTNPEEKKSTSKQTDNIKKVEQRANIIINRLQSRYSDLMCLPENTRSKLGKELISNMSTTFSESTFKKAWGLLRSRGLVKHINHDQYISGK